MRRTYTGFRIGDVARQARAARRPLDPAATEAHLCRVRRDLRRLEDAMDQPLRGLDVLEVGPGQSLERAHLLGMENAVTALDLDVVPDSARPWSYLDTVRANGPTRALKSLGREVLIGRRQRVAWVAATGADRFIRPATLQGDVCSTTLDQRFDAVVSWSVFEHLDDPRAALSQVLDALRPGGGLLISIHLFTSHDGHHDMRSFTGRASSLPPWPHLRASTAHLVRPSAHLNRWRLSDYRAMMDDLAPGHTEYLDQYEVPETMGPLLEDASLVAELGGHRREELLTVNACYTWRKHLDTED